MQRLLVLGLRIGVKDDPAAHLIIEVFALVDERTDGDVEIHGSVESDVADRTRINGTDRRLELVDDFHGTDLGTSRDRASWKGGPEEVREVSARRHSARHDTHEMKDVRVCLQGCSILYPYCSVGTDPAYIVP